VKKTLKEPPYFDGYSLDAIIYLRSVQTLEDYFEAKAYLNEENFNITTQKLQAYNKYWFRYLRRERALKVRLELRLEVGSNPTWIRDSTEIYS